MKIKKTVVFGFEPAISRAMRNPKESWSRSDSVFYDFSAWMQLPDSINWDENCRVPEMPVIGPADLKLAKQLIKGGSEHRKFMRQIMIWADLTLPRYVWQELDTYKVSTVRNSCSTMHKLGHTNLEFSDFQDSQCRKEVLDYLNGLGNTYRETKDYNMVKLMKAHLPESFLQKATYTMNYETAFSMYHQRKKHRLYEWRDGQPGSICSWIKSLPYMNEFISE